MSVAQHLWWRDPGDSTWKEVNNLDSSGKGIWVMVGTTWQKVKQLYLRRSGSWNLGYERFFAPTVPSSLSLSVTFDALEEITPGSGSASWSANGAHEYSEWKLERRKNSGAWTVGYKSGSGYFDSVTFATNSLSRYSDSASTTTAFQLSVRRVHDQSGETTGWSTVATADKRFDAAFP